MNSLGKIGHSKNEPTGTLRRPAFLCGFLLFYFIVIIFQLIFLQYRYSCISLQSLIVKQERNFPLVVSSPCFTSCNNCTEITKTPSSEVNVNCPVKLGYT